MSKYVQSKKKSLTPHPALQTGCHMYITLYEVKCLNIFFLKPEGNSNNRQLE